VRRGGLWLFLLGGLAGGPVAAQDATFESRLPREVLTAVQPVLEAARRDSLPVSELQSKILEGVAKGVPSDRIVTVLSSLSRELRTARTALRTAMPNMELADGEVLGTALATRHGVPTEQLLTLWENRPADGSLEVPLVIVGELSRRGIAPTDAVDLMNHVLRSGTALSTAAQLPSKLDLFLPNAGAPHAALLEALRSLGIPRPPRGPPGH